MKKINGLKIQTALRAGNNGNGRGGGGRNDGTTTSSDQCAGNQGLVNIDGTGCKCYNDSIIRTYTRAGHDVQQC